MNKIKKIEHNGIKVELIGRIGKLFKNKIRNYERLKVK